MIESNLKSDFRSKMDMLHYLYRKKIITQTEFRDYMLELVGVNKK